MSNRGKAHASGTLAGVVARTLTGSLDQSVGDGATIVRCPPVSVFENARATLIRAGVIDGFQDNQIALAIEDFPSHFIATHDDRMFADVLRAFFEVGCHEGHLSEDRDAFEPHPSHLAAMRELSILGFADEVDGSFEWSDLAGTAMVAAGLWDPEFRSRRFVQMRDTNRAANKAMETMPDKVRNAFFDKGAPTTRAEVFNLASTLDELAKTGEWPWIDDDFVWVEDMDVARALIARVVRTKKSNS